MLDIYNNSVQQSRRQKLKISKGGQNRDFGQVVGHLVYDFSTKLLSRVHTFLGESLWDTENILSGAHSRLLYSCGSLTKH